MSNSVRPGALVRAAQNALERRVSSSREEMGLQQSRFLVRTIIWVLLGTTGAAFAWLALAKTEEIVVAPGKLEPIGEVNTIQMPVGGVLRQMLVKEGQKVSKGQVLLRLDNEASFSRDQELRKSLMAKQQQLALKQQELRRYLDLNSSEQLTSSKSLGLERTISDRLGSLQQQGAVAELQSLQQANKVQEAEGQLQRLRMDRRRQTAILEQQIQELESGLADLRSRLSESNMAIRYQDVRSPVNGVVWPPLAVSPPAASRVLRCDARLKSGYPLRGPAPLRLSGSNRPRGRALFRIPIGCPRHSAPTAGQP